ncbi:hypothetical protein [Micromonospora sp. NPDC050200]|uniref:hypothetical protein n=1 Tax=Micromonospora sp. NPDC050200 TaxID=3155664 RepID=UPI003406FBFD
MAFRTWGRLLLTALGVSVLAGAGQLGIAYGFGIVRLTGAFTDVNRWPAQLAWVGWFAVTAAVVGAVVTVRLARREGLPDGTGMQLALSGAAALGATVVAPLCMQPARAAELNTIDPVWAAGICAIVGAVVGAGAASAVLLRPPLGWNVALLAGAVWLIALVSAAPALLSTGPLNTVRLGVLEPSWLDGDAAQRLAMLVLPAVALLAGVATGGLARWRGHVPLVVGATGAAGPVLLAFAYLTAGPGDPVDRYQLAPYYGAVIAVAAGALGSAAAALLRWPLFPAGADDAVEPTDILRPLPDTPALGTASGEGSTTVDLTGADTSPGHGTSAGPDPAADRAVEPTPAHWDWPVTPGTPTTAPAPSGTRPDARFALDAPATEPAPATGNEPSGREPEEPSYGGLQVGGSRAPEVDPPAATPAGAPHPRDRRTTPAESPRASEPAAPAAEPMPATTSADEPPAVPSDEPRAADPVESPRAADPADELGTVVPGPVTPQITTGSAAEMAPASDAVDATPAAGPVELPRPAGPVEVAQASGADEASPTADRPGTAEPADAAATVAPRPRPKRTRKPRSSRSAEPADATPISPATAAAPTATTDPAATDPASPAPLASPAASRTVPAKQAARTVTESSAAPAPADSPAPAPAARTGTDTGTAAGLDKDALDTAGLGAARPDPARTASMADDTHDAPASRSGTRSTASGADRPPVGRTPATADTGATPATADTRATPATADTRATPATADTGATPATAEPAPRPRHQLPDLNSGVGWNTFAAPRPASAPPRAELPFPDYGPDEEPKPVTFRWDADEARPSTPRTAGGASDLPAAEAPGPPVDARPTVRSPEVDAEPAADRSRPKRGLFRRNKARGPGQPAEAPEAEPLAAQDEEFVDWVTGLSRPLADNEPETESGRRSLRSTGRHHRD